MSWGAVVGAIIEGIGNIAAGGILAADLDAQIAEIDRLPGLTDSQRKELLSLYLEPLQGIEREKEVKARQALAKQPDISTSDLIMQEQASKEGAVAGRVAAADEIMEIEAGVMKAKRDEKARLQAAFSKNLMHMATGGMAAMGKGIGEAVDTGLKTEQAKTLGEMDLPQVEGAVNIAVDDYEDLYEEAEDKSYGEDFKFDDDDDEEDE